MSSRELQEAIEAGQEVEASLDEGSGSGFVLRQKIRDTEDEIQKLAQKKLDSGLPSEDSIMDHPTRYDTRMRKKLGLLQKVRAAIEAYYKFDVM